TISSLIPSSYPTLPRSSRLSVSHPPASRSSLRPMPPTPAPADRGPSDPEYPPQLPTPAHTPGTAANTTIHEGHIRTACTNKTVAPADAGTPAKPPSPPSSKPSPSATLSTSARDRQTPPSCAFSPQPHNPFPARMRSAPPPAISESPKSNLVAA